MKFGVFDHMDDAGVPHEEPYMPDQMSDGRLELDVGRGVSSFNTVAYSLAFAQARAT